MSDNLKPPRPSAVHATSNDLLKEKENLRALSRSPHPYHRQNWELLEPSDTITTRASSIPTHRFEDVRQQLLPSPAFTKDSTPTTDSGTEADDENFVKKLPAPRARLHKGLRGRPEPPSGFATPLLTPTAVDGDLEILGKVKGKTKEDQKRALAEKIRRDKEVIRRGSEILILAGLAKVVISNPDAEIAVAIWGNGMRTLRETFSSYIKVLMCGQNCKSSAHFTLRYWHYTLVEPLYGRIGGDGL